MATLKSVEFGVRGRAGDLTSYEQVAAVGDDLASWTTGWR